MRGGVIAAAALALMVAPPARGGQLEHYSVCQPVEDALDSVAQDGMRPVFRGAAVDGALGTLVVGSEGQWAFLLILPTGEACILELGEDGLLRAPGQDM